MVFVVKLVIQNKLINKTMVTTTFILKSLRDLYLSILYLNCFLCNCTVNGLMFWAKTKSEKSLAIHIPKLQTEINKF